jgi:hypothetical protein
LVSTVFDQNMTCIHKIEIFEFPLTISLKILKTDLPSRTSFCLFRCLLLHFSICGNTIFILFFLVSRYGFSSNETITPKIEVFRCQLTVTLKILKIDLPSQKFISKRSFSLQRSHFDNLNSCITWTISLHDLFVNLVG